VVPKSDPCEMHAFLPDNFFLTLEIC